MSTHARPSLLLIVRLKLSPVICLVVCHHLLYDSSSTMNGSAAASRNEHADSNHYQTQNVSEAPGNSVNTLPSMPTHVHLMALIRIGTT